MTDTIFEWYCERVALKGLDCRINAALDAYKSTHPHDSKLRETLSNFLNQRERGERKKIKD